MNRPQNPADVHALLRAAASEYFGRQFLKRPPKLKVDLEAQVEGINTRDLARWRRFLHITCDYCKGSPLVGTANGVVKPSGEVLILSHPNVWLLPDNSPGPVIVTLIHPHLKDEMEQICEHLALRDPNSAQFAAQIRSTVRGTYSDWELNPRAIDARWDVESMERLGARGNYRWECQTCDKGACTVSADRMHRLLRMAFPVEQTLTLSLSRLAALITQD